MAKLKRHSFSEPGGMKKAAKRYEISRGTGQPITGRPETVYSQSEVFDILLVLSWRWCHVIAKSGYEKSPPTQCPTPVEIYFGVRLESGTMGKFNILIYTHNCVLEKNKMCKH